jgi:hypothetical protein
MELLKEADIKRTPEYWVVKSIELRYNCSIFPELYFHALGTESYGEYRTDPNTKPPRKLTGYEIYISKNHGLSGNIFQELDKSIKIRAMID